MRPKETGRSDTNWFATTALVLALTCTPFVFSIPAPDSTTGVPRTVSKKRISHFARMEREIAKEPVRKAVIRAKTIELAKEYEKEDRIQEAIWALRKGGHDEKANQLEKKLIESLSNEKIHFVHEFFPHGKDASELYQLKGRNIFGVLKRNSQWHMLETLAYRLDRILDLNLVPVTIERFGGPERGIVSFQYYVRDAANANQLHEKSAENFRYYPYPHEHKNMWLLDYLLNNSDRHGSNWLRMFGDLKGRVVAIDHGISLDRGTSHVDFREEYLPSADLLEKLRQIDFESLKKEFKGIEPNLLDSIRERRDQIIKLASAKNVDSGCSGILRRLGASF